jgi:hypothetical protein
MFAPEAQKAGENVPTTIITARLVTAVGVFLTYKSIFGREIEPGRSRRTP